MAAREDAVVGLAFDDGKARASLGKVRGEVGKLATETSGAGGAMTKLGASVKTAEPAIGKGASVVSGLAGVMGPLGGSTNAASGAIASLAGAFTIGPAGGLIAVVGAAVFGLGALAASETEAREEAEKLAKEYEDGLLVRLRDLEKGAQDAETELRNFGLTSQQVRALEAEASLLQAQTDKERAEFRGPQIKEELALEKERLKLALARAAMDAADVGGGSIRANQELKIQRDRVKTLEADQQLAEAALTRATREEESAQRKFTAIQKIMMAEKDQEDARDASANRSKARSKAEADGLRENAALMRSIAQQGEQDDKDSAARGAAKMAAADRLDKFAENMAKGDLDRLAKQAAEERRVGEMRTKLRAENIANEKAALKEREQAHRETAQAIAAFTGALAQQAADDTFAAMEAVAAGEEFALEATVINMAQRAGTSLIASGVSAVGAGIAEMAVTGGVAGGGAIIVGSQLIVAGGALGGSAAIASGLLSSGAVQGVDIGQGGLSLASRGGGAGAAIATGGPGASSSSAVAGERPIVQTIVNYHGPVVDSSGSFARLVDDHQKIAKRDLLARV